DNAPPLPNRDRDSEKHTTFKDASDRASEQVRTLRAHRAIAAPGASVPSGLCPLSGVLRLWQADRERPQKGRTFAVSTPQRMAGFAQRSVWVAFYYHAPTQRVLIFIFSGAPLLLPN